MAEWVGAWQSISKVVFDNHHQQLTVLSRAADKLDVFVIGNEGHVWTTGGNDHDGWVGDAWRVPGNAVFDPEHQRVAAATIASDWMRLFLLDSSGRIRSQVWSGGNWHSDWDVIEGQAAFDPFNQQIALTRRTTGNIDLFMIGNDDRLWTKFWNSIQGWGQAFRVPAAQTFQPQHRRVSAVSRSPGNIDVFVIGDNDRVWTTAWPKPGSTGWVDNAWQLPGTATFDRTSQRVAVVSREVGNLEVFAIDVENRILWQSWNAGSPWLPEWRVLASDGADYRLQNIAAVSRTPNTIDLFVVGMDNRVYNISWDSARVAGSDAATGWIPVAEVPGAARVDQEQHITAICRTADRIDLFVIGQDGAIWTTGWGPT